jgi:citrate lyase beta subunit
MAIDPDPIASIRTNQLVAPGAGVSATAADALTLDFTSGLRKLAGTSRRRASTSVARPPYHVRIAVDRSGIAPAVEAAVAVEVTAVLLTGVERAQDVRDADVAIRRHELRLGLEPGAVRLITEVRTAIALRALPHILESIDRHSAVALNTDALATDLGLPGPPASHLAILDHAMAEVALTARAGRIGWLLLAPALDGGARAALATRAHAHGAAGVYIVAEPEAHGFNSLFTR